MPASASAMLENIDMDTAATGFEGSRASFQDFRTSNQAACAMPGSSAGVTDPDVPSYRALVALARRASTPWPSTREATTEAVGRRRTRPHACRKVVIRQNPGRVETVDFPYLWVRHFRP
jgi:hypothetical protein